MWLAVVLAIATAASQASRAEERGRTAAACPVPIAPTVEGERTPRRGQRGFDTAPLAYEPATPLLPAPVGAIRRVNVPSGEKLVALTFDFCESFGEIAGYDAEVVEYLRRHRVPATLFMGGKWMASHERRARELIADPLFEIAGHGWAHRNVRALTGAALRAEIAGPAAVHDRVRTSLATGVCPLPQPARLGVPMRLVRFPFGACNPQALAATAALGLRPVQWDISTGDASPGQGPQAIAATVLTRVRPGSIVLAHANGRGWNTAAALPLLVPQLRARGYRLVTVGELLAAGTPEITGSCYDQRPGDTDRYDALFRRPAAIPQ